MGDSPPDAIQLDAIKVLVVEDTPSDAELAAAVLADTWPQLDWRRVASDADFRHGLAWCPDVIIADYEVPGFGAVAALRVLQELNSEIPLIVFTGAVTEETVVRCMRLGAADYLLKDRLTRLSSAVSNALSMRKERDAKRASEREQKRLAEINSAILRSLPAHVALLDCEGRVVAVNEAWQRNGTPESFDDPRCSVGENYLAVCSKATGEHAADTAQVVEGLRALLAGTRDSFVYEYACHTLTEKRWLRMMATPVSRGGKDGAVVMMLNVTDRKLAEEQIKINANALRNLSEAVVVTDRDLRIVSVNKAFSTLTGYSAEKTLGKRLSELLVREQPQMLIENIRTAVIHDGGWKGELRSRRANGELFPAFFSFSAVRNGAGDMEYFTAVFTDLSTFREFERRIEYLSHSDSLTGLPNRTTLATQLQQACEAGTTKHTSMALLVAELDSFKTVNDTVGHATGDLLLKAVADRLRRSIRHGDVLARLGGDEFGVLAFNITDDDAEQLAESLRNAVEKPFCIAGHDIYITASIGLSSHPKDGADFDALLRAADAAVYRAKQLGRNTIAWYSPEMSHATVERFTLQNGLAQALSRQEFVLEYQPTVDLYTGRLTGAEALLRWRHPAFGLVQPTRFIGLAEDTGLIVPIGDWVLRTACHQVSRWIATGWSDATVAVNLSARQFNQPDLHARITECLASANIEPWRLRLEVTESMVMSDPDRAADTLQRLALMGVQLALDDFGTGYSSLSYLKRFRLGCVKIDRSFVSGVASDDEDASIVRAIIALGKALNMKIVAEGIETSAQAEFLRNAGCDDGQGYYYSMATNPTEVRMLAARRFPHASGCLQSQLDLVIGNA